ncbi:MAG: transglutaminase-like domain-containing protein [Clostridiales bacterium]|nr:transglutaminase-like domain-containing protein [Clostridiales bacterium]
MANFINILTVAEENHIEEIDCSDFELTLNDIRYAFSFVWRKKPYLYGVNTFNYLTNDKGFIESINLIYEYSTEEMYSQRKEIDEIADSIVSITEGLSNPEKIKIVYDYFAENYTYDYKLSGKDYTIYTMFTEKKGRCMTFSTAFKLIMDKMDIPCKVETNLTSTEQDMDKPYHAWNRVYVGDKWLTIDLTKKLYLANDLLSALHGLPYA